MSSLVKISNESANLCDAANIVTKIIDEATEDLEFTYTRMRFQLQHQKKFEFVLNEIQLFRIIGHYWLRKPCEEMKSNNQYLTDIIINNYEKSNVEDDKDIYEYNTLTNIKKETFEIVKIHLIEEYCWHVVFGYYDTYVKMSELFFKIYIPYNIIQKMIMECDQERAKYREIDTSCIWKDYNEFSLPSYYKMSYAKVNLPQEYTTKYSLDVSSDDEESEEDEDFSDDEDSFSSRHIQVLRHLMDINKFQNYKFSYKVDALFTWDGFVLDDYIKLEFINSHITKHTFI